MTLFLLRPFYRALALGGAAVLMASGAGCAVGNDPVVGEAVPSDPAPESATASGPRPSEKDDPAQETPLQDQAIDVAADGTYVVSGDQASFVMPSGNIQCVMRSGSVVCQISQKRFEPAAKDLSDAVLGECGTNNADALTLLDNDVAAWTCTSETIRGQASIDLGGWWAADGVGDTESVDGLDLAVLNYGQAIQLGSILCSSESAGISCRDTASSAGFTLAREDYTVN
ncbi:MAG: hypothetical protein WA991_04145 [Ornithinimicrobium sp.]